MNEKDENTNDPTDYGLAEHEGMIIRFMGHATYINRIGGKQYIRTMDSAEEQRMFRRIYAHLLLDQLMDGLDNFDCGNDCPEDEK